MNCFINSNVNIVFKRLRHAILEKLYIYAFNENLELDKESYIIFSIMKSNFE